MGPFRKFRKTRILVESGKFTCLTKRLSPARKFFKGDHWIVPELRQLVTEPNHHKNMIILMADIGL